LKPLDKSYRKSWSSVAMPRRAPRAARTAHGGGSCVGEWNEGVRLGRIGAGPGRDHFGTRCRSRLRLARTLHREPAAQSYSWAGPYLGGNLGYDWGDVSNNPTKPSGLAGGATAGYNWQSTQHWVFGVEGDIEATGADDTFAPWKFSNPWFGTV